MKRRIIAVECELIDTSGLFLRSKSLGKRFVCASNEMWNKSILSKVEQKMTLYPEKEVENIFLSTSVSVREVDSEDLFDGDFVLFPADTKFWRDDSLPAGFLSKGSASRYAFTYFTSSGETQLITVNFDNFVLPEEAKQYKEWWWYPNQILVIPAYAVDVITSPIQFLVVALTLDTLQ